MCFRAWLGQALPTMQGDSGTGSGDEEYTPCPESCTCQRPRDPRQPSPHLPEGNQKFYVEHGEPLYRAALNGDREKVQQILDQLESPLRSSPTPVHETALQVESPLRSSPTPVHETALQVESPLRSSPTPVHETALQVESPLRSSPTPVHETALQVESPLRSSPTPVHETALQVESHLRSSLTTAHETRERDHQVESLLCSSLTTAHETALHVAVGARQAAVVEELVQKMESGDLELQDDSGNTAFCVAVATGSVNIARILMDNNADLAFIRGAYNKTPLYIAAVFGYPEMVWFLYEIFKPHIPRLNEEEQRDIFFACIQAGLFDLAITMLIVPGNVLAWAHDGEETALGILARKPSAFAGNSSTTRKTLIDMCFGSNTINMQHKALELTKLLCKTMKSDEQKSYEESTGHASKSLFEAARLGNYNFLAVLIGSFPDLIFRKDNKGKSIFHIAVLHRHASIFNHIHNLGLRKDLIMRYTVDNSDQEGTSIFYNMLHLAAKLPSLDRLNIVTGAALQMQRELLWFKEVENLTPPSERAKRDSKDKLTPYELFTKEHEELRKAGETWMKKTAESGMIVATIITTVVFTTASSLPGGTDEGDGSPKNKEKTMFHVFAVADSVAMCSSIISTMMFLSILTSRYAEKDFLFQLPFKLVVGLTTLLVSMMALMVSFSATYFLLYSQSKLKWVPILASAMSFLPAALFGWLQYHLLLDVFRSTFGSRYIFRPNKSTFWESFNKLFNENVSN